MKRIATVSGLIAATALALGAMTGTAAADNNAEVQNITIPVCLDLGALQGSGVYGGDGCNVVDVHSEKGVGVS
ncbi:hypothetical protein ACFPZ0_01995 [Streptomonospora nanhaiensis]|uniref:Chaplin domain-containing protein n=1 Tax=Streptomonospora nanhaiensis TaxID=1323731 RepID=A0A853BLD4_9ACTN|nr:hypothetical protein [Streptomonospora nanhaiensis]MBV2361813.1 hypothetical protein [Streptomonospora nanhaiensis]MBX9388336.1 hypothetical protein [Streptomonospora nanhaiensis]NYI96369.1 hypothetical protein [Streptomonospora nanhaiensis]